jgi:hypothetical protein
LQKTGYDGDMELLTELIGKKVALLTEMGATERQEIGILQEAKGHWVKVEKDNNEIVYYSVYLIRQIKQFGH